MTTPKLKTLVQQVGDVLGHWGETLDQTRELTPVLLGTDANGKTVLVDRAVYVEDATGGYWTLASGNPINDPVTGQAIARPTFTNVLQQVVASGQHWQVEQAWSPVSRATDVQFRDDAPYLVRIVDGRAIVDDWGVENADGSWSLFSGMPVLAPDGLPVAHATVEDILRMPHADGQEWRVEALGYNPLANIDVEHIGVRFTDGVAVDYTVRVTDQDGTFYVWARNLDRALELEAKTGDSRGFNLRNYEIDFDNLDEVGSTDDSTYRVELLTPAQFNFALSLGSIEFHPEMLTAVMNNATGHLAYSVNSSGQASLSPDHYESPIKPMITLLDQAMQQYVITSRRLAVRLALQGGLSEFAQGITYDAAADKYRPVGGRELAPLFQAIFDGAPPNNNNDAAFDYLTDWNELLWQIYPDYAPNAQGNMWGSTVGVDQAYIFQFMLPAFENSSIAGLSIQAAAHALAIDETKIITHLASDVVVHGTGGNDFIYMSSGNQDFDGGSGSDYYFVGQNSGTDRIYDRDLGENDELRFTEIASNQVIATRIGQDLILTFDGRQITVRDQFLGELNDYSTSGKQFESGVNAIVFADGVIWDRTRLAMMVAHPADTNDFYLGSGSGDVLWGGKGNDVLRGGAGGDYYIFSRGDGQDLISEQGSFSLGSVKAGLDFLAFKGDITADDLWLIRDGPSDNLKIYILDENGQLNRDANGQITNDGIEIEGQFGGIRLNLGGLSGLFGGSDGLDYISPNLIERFIFDDGTSLDFTQIVERVLANARTSGDDAIYGLLNDNTIDGGAGDDYLTGIEGGDTYVFGRGYDHDVFEDADYSMKLFGAPDDHLKFIDDLRWTDFDYLRDGPSDTLTMQIKGTEDKVTLVDFLKSLPFIGYINLLEQIHFGDGTTWSYLQLLQHYIDVAETTGNDNVFGFEGISDTFEGGLGDDVLKGFSGNDLYIFKPGDGHDIIEDSDGDDTVEFRGIATTDVVFTRTDLDLIITVVATGERVVLQNQYVRDGAQHYAVEHLVFSDRTVDFTEVNPEDIDLDFRNGSATTGDDVITGSNFAETLDGLQGNDTLIGNDGGDTYKFDVGYGSDTIIDTRIRASWGDRRGFRVPVDDVVKFGSDLTDLYIQDQGNLVFTKDGNDLVISIRNRPDVLRIQNQFRSADDGVEKFTFTNGWTLSIAEVEQLLQYAGGNRGDNNLGDPNATAPMVLDGRQGFDTLSGGTGADTYAFSAGYDFDRIIEKNNVANVIDKVVFGASVRREDLVISRSGNDLVIDLGNGLDVLTIVGGVATTGVEEFWFADGTILTLNQILDQMLTGGDADENLVGFSNRADTISGGGGSDAMSGGTGNDTYKYGFGDGDDSVSDSAGVDKIVFGTGITQDQVKFQNINGNLLITLSTGTDRLVVLGGYSDTAQPVESFVFADGTSLTLAEVRSIIRDGQPYDSQDLIDLRVLDPGPTISPGAGNDILTMANNSRVVFHSGDGVDRVETPSGIVGAVVEFADFAASDAVVRLASIDPADPHSQDLIIAFPSTGDQVVIAGALGSGALPSIVFADGTTWDAATLVQQSISAQTGDEDDVILGSTRADLIAGGHGDDQLRGGAGNDTYEFNRGDGRDVIDDTSGTETLKITGYRPDELIVRLSAPGRNELLLSFGDDSDAILLRYDASRNGVDKVQFSDGTVLTQDQLFDLVIGTGTDGDDILLGTTRAESFDGGRGNDIIQGNGGADVFHFDRGDGQDRIQTSGTSDGLGILEFGQDITQADIAVRRDGAGNLVLSIVGSDDRITLIDPINDIDPTVVRVRFSDLTFWTAAELALRAAATTGDDHIIVPTDTVNGGGGSGANIAGGAGNDWLEGGRGADILDGGKGDDRLEGKTGSDIYYFQRGDGQDVIIDYDEFSRTNTDRLRFGPGIALSDLRFARVGPRDLVITLVGTTDRITIKDMFTESGNPTDNGIEEIAFADSPTVLNLQQIYDQLGVGTAGDDVINLGSDLAIAATLDGKGGDDMLAGGKGNNTYKFDRGYGRDIISETNLSSSNDTLLLGVGLVPSDLIVIRSGGDVIIRVKGTDDRITIQGANAGWTPIEKVVFNDGTQWTAAQLLSFAITPDAAEALIHPASAADPFASSLFNGASGGSGGGSTSGGDDWIDPNGGGGTGGGTSGDQVINGTSGDDNISGLAGDDTIFGGLGDDTLFGNADYDVLYGGEGNDDLYGGVDYDDLYGDAGNDTLHGGRQGDYLDGGAGDDHLIGDDESDQIDPLSLDPNGALRDYFGVVDHNLINNLGGPLGFGANSVSPDDYYTSVDLPPEFLAAFTGMPNVDGTDVDYIWVDTGGSVGIGDDLWIDVLISDVNNEAGPVAASPGGNSRGSNRVWYAFDAATRTITFTWDDITQDEDNGPGTVGNAFQLQVRLNENGSADFVFRYENVNWSDGWDIPGVYLYTSNRDEWHIPLPIGGESTLDTSMGNLGVPGVWAGQLRNGELVGLSPEYLWEEDSLYGDEGNDLLEGGVGDDYLVGGTGNDTLLGGAGGDDLYGNEDDDVIEGGAGRDYGHGNSGNDIVRGGDDADWIYGDEGDDQVFGEQGSDYLSGGAGNDLLDGGVGKDELYGDDGDDTLIGDSLSDVESTVDPQQLAEITTYFGALDNSLVNGLGGDIGFGEGVLDTGDDDDFTIDVPASFLAATSTVNGFITVNNNGVLNVNGLSISIWGGDVYTEDGPIDPSPAATARAAIASGTTSTMRRRR